MKVYKMNNNFSLNKIKAYLRNRNYIQALFDENQREFVKLLNIIALGLLSLRLIQMFLASYAYTIFTFLNIKADTLVGYYLLSSFVFVISLAFPLLFFKTAHKNKNDKLFSFSVQKPGRFLLLMFLGLGLCMFSNVVSGIIYAISTYFGHPLSNVSIYYDGSVKLAVILVITNCLLPAVFEEFLFRGFILNSLKKYGNFMALVLSSLLFALMHSTAMQLPFAFICGISLAYIALLSQSILCPMFVHFLVNLTSVISVISERTLGESHSNTFFSFSMYIFLLLGILSYVILRNKKLLKLDLSKSKLSLKAFLRTCFFAPLFIVFFVFICISTFSVVVA